MTIDAGPLLQSLAIFGGATVILALLLLLSLITLAAIIVLSMKHNKFYFPRFIRAGFRSMGGIMRTSCRSIGIKNYDLMAFFIRLHNSMSVNDFARTEVKDRAIFLPHCLRSSQCPAKLSTEGLSCMHCGRCDLDHTVNELEAMGYKVFIVPGSTFVGRMVKKYLPHAIIGVGCIREVVDGLEFADRLGIIVMGVINRTEGCVETLADLPELLSIAALKAPEQ